MNPVTVDLSQLLYAAFVGAIGLLWYNFKNDRSTMEGRIQKLETIYLDYTKSVATMSSEISKQIADLKLEFSRAHPTKSELDALMARHEERLRGIEGELRQIAHNLVPAEMIETRKPPRTAQR